MTSNVREMPFRRRPVFTWADRIRKVRRDAGMTQAEFAKLVGYSESRLEAWETGRNTPSKPSEIAVQLEERTGVDRLWWIGWADDGGESTGDMVTRRYVPPKLSLTATAHPRLTCDRPMLWAVP